MPDGRVAIEQSERSTIVLSADQILGIISQLHACYDYCATWKDEDTGANETSHE
jgi:hypothetical protein